MQVKAEATVDGDSVAVRILEEPLSAAGVPESLLRYVTRTREQVIIEDAAPPNSFSAEEHLGEKAPRSVACLPLLKQGELIALLYLQNKLAAHVFTPARLKILAVLASQAAISLENSRLYHEIQRAEAERRVAEQARDKARSELAHSARVMSLGTLTASIAHEINQPISAAVTSASACLRWLDRDEPDVQRAREAALRIEEDGKRAAAIITHLKSFYKKDVSPQREPVSITDIVGEMLVLLRSEADRHGHAHGAGGGPALGECRPGTVATGVDEPHAERNGGDERARRRAQDQHPTRGRRGDGVGA
jgi:signal transduction histidine kinase